MVAAKTVEEYISRCDKVLASPDKMNAESPEIEIVSVFVSEFKGFKQGLRRYGVGVLDGMGREDYIKDLMLIRAKLKKELDAMEPQYDAEEYQNHAKKIFISHATKDKDYVGELIKLLESLGFREDEIICSSIPPYCIPLDNNVYNWLVNEFRQSDLHVIYALSKTYYNRPACLNEMGAAWAMKQKWTAILLPGFEFNEIAGCIDPLQVSIKLDDRDRDTLQFRLGELKDILISEFGLRPLSDFLWEKKRNEFLDSISTVLAKRAEERFDEKGDEESSPVVGQSDVRIVPVDSAFLLVYAADGDGQIRRIQMLGSEIQVSTSGKQFMADESSRESARWVEALDRLIKWEWVKDIGHKGRVFQLIGTGYKKADWLKEGMGINTDNEPLEELKGFVD